jgi:hypothetical protein
MKAFKSVFLGNPPIPVELPKEQNKSKIGPHKVQAQQHGYFLGENFLDIKGLQ